MEGRAARTFARCACATPIPTRWPPPCLPSPSRGLYHVTAEQEYCRAQSRRGFCKPSNTDATAESKDAGRDGGDGDGSSDGSGSGLPLSLEAFGEVIQAHGKGLLRRFLAIGVRVDGRGCRCLPSSQCCLAWLVDATVVVGLAHGAARTHARRALPRAIALPGPCTECGLSAGGETRCIFSACL